MLVALFVVVAVADAVAVARSSGPPDRTSAVVTEIEGAVPAS
ncbi:hypothetical protein [Salana multivorans]